MNKIRRSRISSLVLFLVTLPYIEPQIFKIEFQFIDNIYAILKLSSSLIIICIYLLYFRFKISVAVILTCILQGWILLSTVVNHGSLVTYFGPSLTMISMFMIFEISLYDNWVKYLIYIRNLLSVFILINCFTILLVKASIIDSAFYFLGMDNRWIYFILPWIILNFVLTSFNKQNIHRAWLSWGIGFCSLLITWSVGAMIAVGLFPIFCLIWNSRKLFKQLRANSIYPTILVILILNYLLTNQIILNYFRRIINNIFHKDITLAGRIYLWEAVYEVLSKNPLFGIGVLSNDKSINFFYVASGFVDACRVNHPHNFILYFAYRGGYIALLIFVSLVIYIFVQIKKSFNSSLSKYVFSGIVSILAASLVDTFDFSLTYLVFAIAANAYFIQKQFKGRCND